MHATTLLASLLALGSTTQALEFWQTFPKSPSCVEYPFVEEAKGLWDPQMEFCHNQPIPFKGFRFSNSDGTKGPLLSRSASPDNEICDLTIYSQVNCFEPQKLHTHEDIFSTPNGACFSVTQKFTNKLSGTAKSSKLTCRPRKPVVHHPSLVPVSTVKESTIRASTVYSTMDVKSTIETGTMQAQSSTGTEVGKFTTLTSTETVVVTPESSMRTVYGTDKGYGSSATTSGLSGYSASTTTSGLAGYGASTTTSGLSGYGASTTTSGLSGYSASTTTSGLAGYGASTATSGLSGYWAHTATSGLSGYGASTTSSAAGYGASVTTTSSPTGPYKSV